MRRTSGAKPAVALTTNVCAPCRSAATMTTTATPTTMPMIVSAERVRFARTESHARDIDSRNRLILALRVSCTVRSDQAGTPTQTARSASGKTQTCR